MLMASAAAVRMFLCINIYVCLWLNSSASFNKCAAKRCCKTEPMRFFSALEVLSLIHISDCKELRNRDTAFLVMQENRKTVVARRQYMNSSEQCPLPSPDNSDNSATFQRHHLKQNTMLDR